MNKMRPYSINLKLTIPLLIMGLVSALQFSYLLNELSNVQQNIERKADAISELELLTFSLNQKENNLRTLLFDFYVSKKPEFLHAIEKERLGIIKVLAELTTLDEFNLIAHDANQYLTHRANLTSLADRFIQNVANGNIAATSNTFQQWKIKEEQMSALHMDFMGSIYNLNHASLRDLKSYLDNQTTLFFVFILINIILIISTFFITRKIIVRPLHKLKHAARSVAKGNYDIDVDHKANDELSSLSKSFASMSKNVKKFNVELECIVEKRTEELNLEISQRKNAEAELRNKMIELERSNQDLAQFAYVASHDLQEPLRMVASYTQLIEQRYSDKLDQDGKEFVGFAVEGAVRMQKLIKDLLEYSRINRKELNLGIVNLAQTLSEIERNLSYLLKSSEGKIEYSEHLTDIDIVTDESLLLLLLQNLITNGIKFQKDSSPIIRIEIDSDKTHWHISVSDNGIGIKEEFQPRIFKVFQRLHSRSDYEGNGMGLSICNNIAEKFGGRIWVESCYGEGSTFHFTIEKKQWLGDERENANVQIYQDIAG
ncbi:ATP-binding protein [Vibrio profundum]|uniref:sensor histidine kinase n=1 Tax=Vibrio profundum TaxID=2910247 RepID=UPI003D0D8095